MNSEQQITNKNHLFLFALNDVKFLLTRLIKERITPHIVYDDSSKRNLLLTGRWYQPFFLRFFFYYINEEAF